MTLINWLKANAGRHLEALVIAGVLVVTGRLWLQEHDARLQSDAAVKTAQSTIDGLRQQQGAVEKAAKVQVTILQKQADAVRTAPEAVQSLQTPTAALADAVAPLDVTTVPDAPERVAVNALPLYADLNTCQQDALSLGACTKSLDLQKQIMKRLTMRMITVPVARRV